MQLTGELAPLGYAHRSTEFIIAPVGPDIGKRIFGACGPTALASCASAALQKLVTTEQVYGLMEPRGLCDASGVTTDGKIATAATALGLTIAEHRAYSEPWNGWDTFLGWHLGSCDHPTLIEVANDLALADLISGLGLNAGTTGYHFIMLLKRHGGGYSAYAGKTLPSGFWACDGASWAGGNGSANGFNATDVLQFYSDTSIMNARPCAGIAFNRAPVTTTTGGGGSVGTAGTATPFFGLDYTSDAQVWHCPATGFDIGHGFLTFYEGVKGSGGQTATQILGLPKSQEYPVGSVTKQDFERGRLVYDGSKADPWQVTLDSTFDSNAAALKAAQYAASTAQAAEVNLQAQLTAAQAQIAQLQAQLAALQNQPAPAPQPAPLTPQQQNDLAAMESIRKALAA